jgi:hypothetical protein
VRVSSGTFRFARLVVVRIQSIWSNELPVVLSACCFSCLLSSVGMFLGGRICWLECLSDFLRPSHPGPAGQYKRLPCSPLRKRVQSATPTACIGVQLTNMRYAVASFAGLLALAQLTAAQNMYDQCGVSSVLYASILMVAYVIHRARTGREAPAALATQLVPT